MAANLTRRLSLLCIGRTLEQQSLPALCNCSSSYLTCVYSRSQSNTYHTSACLCGGRPKSEWRRKRTPAWTKLCPDKPEKLRSRKAFGGTRKTKITRAKEGCYSWKSQDVAFQSPILDVIFNTAHTDFTDHKIMVKGSIVKVGAEKFQEWFDEQYNSKTTAEDTQDFTKRIDGNVLQQIKDGKVLAKISSRPGQEGKVDGYILEGTELDLYLNETKKM